MFLKKFLLKNSTSLV